MRLLIVDDEEPTRYLFSKYLTKAGFLVDEAPTLRSAKSLVSKTRYDAVILDMKLPDGDGLDWLPALVEQSPNTAVLMVTGAGDIPLAVEAMRRGAENFLTKPVDLRGIEIFLKNILETGQLKRRTQAEKRFQQRPDPFWGEGKEMQLAKQFSEIAADSEVPVLIQGETGTGKGVVARWVHEHSNRSALPFVEVNCSVLRGELLASELFGHARGAFTSAVEHKQGLMDLADGGTLFLDEVADMDPAVQPQFLKAVEEKRYRRLGEVAERRSDFRLISATNRDLSKLVATGQFRNDLYFRIAVHFIHLPALTQRQSDFASIVKHMMTSLGYPEVSIDEKAMELLSSYSWPGNIRELRNVLERARLLSRGTNLKVEHFPGLLVSEPNRELNEKPDEYQIQQALHRFRGDKNRAAKSLGISRATLYRKLKQKN